MDNNNGNNHVREQQDLIIIDITIIKFQVWHLAIE